MRWRWWIMSDQSSSVRLKVIVEPDNASIDALGRKVRAVVGSAVGSATSSSTGSRTLDRIAATQARASSRLGGTDLGALGARFGGLAGITRDADRATRVMEKLRAVAGTTMTALGTPAAALDRTAKSLGRIGDNLVRLGAGIFVAERAARAVAGLGRAVGGVYRSILEPNDADRRFELSLAGVTGGNGKRVNDALYRLGRSSPLPLRELQESAQAMAFNPALAGRLTGSVDESAAEVKQYAELVQRLAMMKPTQGAAGANIALAELSAGQWESLRRRFNVAPSAVAAASGKPLSELKRDGAGSIAAVAKWADMFVPQSVVDGAGKLISVRLQKLADVGREAARGISEAGVYDATLDRLQKIGGELSKYFGEDPRWVQQAKRTSVAMERILDNLLGATGRFLQGITGAKTPAETIGGVVEQVVNIFEMWGESSKSLPDIGAKVGQFLGDVGREVRNLTGDIGELVDEMSAFKLGRNLFGQTGVVTAGQLADAEKLRATKIVSFLGDRGILGAKIRPLTRKVYDETVGATADRPATVTDGFTVSTEGIRDPRAALLAEKVISAVEGTGRNEFVTRRFIEQTLSEKGLLDQFQTLRTTTRPTTAPTTAPSSAFDSVIRREGVLPNLGLLVQPAINKLAGIQHDAAHDRLREVLGMGDVFDSNLGSEKDRYTIGDTFGRLAARYEKERGTYKDALAMATDTGQADAIRRDMGKLSTRYDALRTQLTTSMIDASRSFGLSIADALGDLPPAARTVLLDRVMAGTTSVAEHVRAALVAAGEDAAAAKLGFDAMPLRDRLTMQKAYAASRIAGLETGYDVPLGASVDDILGAGRLSENQVGRRILDFLENDPRGLARQRALYADALRNVKPGDEGSLIDLAGAQDQLAAMVEKMRSLRLETNETLKAFREFGNAVQENLGAGVGNAIEGLINGTEDLGSAFKSLARSIVHSFSEISGRMIVNNIFGTPDAQGRGGLGGLLSGNTGGDTGWAGLVVNSVLKGVAGLLGGAAGGGNFNTGGGSFGSAGADFAMAEGGIVTRPITMLAGEAGYPEAVIPLKQGIPQELIGGGGAGGGGMGTDGARTYIVVDSPEEAWVKGFRAGGSDHIVSLVSGQFKRGQKIHQAAKAKGF